MHTISKGFAQTPNFMDILIYNTFCSIKSDMDANTALLGTWVANKKPRLFMTLVDHVHRCATHFEPKNVQIVRYKVIPPEMF